MKEIVNSAIDLREQALKCGSRVSASYALPEGEAPVGGFNMAHNKVTASAEIINFYHQTWLRGGVTACDNEDQVRTQNAERIIEVFKSLFIGCVSVYEFSAKQAISRHPQKIRPIKGRIYLGSIIKETIAVGRLPAGEINAWNGTIDLRDVLVHNNGISDKDVTYKIPGCQDLILKDGRMIKGNLRLFQ